MLVVKLICISVQVGNKPGLNISAMSSLHNNLKADNTQSKLVPCVESIIALFYYHSYMKFCFKISVCDMVQSLI